MQTDISDESQVQALVAEAVKWGGGVDLYVNNAAKFAFGNVNTVSGQGMRLLQLADTSFLTQLCGSIKSHC